MAHRDIIVIGTSRGGLDALRRLVSQLPRDLDAAVLIVQHMAASGPSLLGELLSASGPLQAAAGVDGERIVPGRIYVAVPDRHLVIEGDHIRLSRGPKESHARPSVDVLFRSAAYHAGRRVIGIVLTGQLDDGTAGLWAIKERGGIAIVQDPAEAPFPSMPQSALEHVAIDYTVRIDAMPGLLQWLTGETLAEERESTMSDQRLEIETGIALESDALNRGVRSLGSPSFHTCPECHGSMVSIQEGSFRRFRCHTGHGFSQGALAEQGLAQIERTLWSALAQIEEHLLLLAELAENAHQDDRAEIAELHARRAEQIRDLAERVRLLALDPLLSGNEDAAGMIRAGVTGKPAQA
jgi:two-component system, chemotaxis family, protein-glutamate methylesterase/glutaminase